MEFLPEELSNFETGIMVVWGMRLLSAVLILIAGWVLGNWASRSIKRIKKLDNTLKSFLGGLAKYAILAVAIITILGQFGVQTASLLALLGAAGLAIGLALQRTLSNVAAGVMLLILRPFNVGDYIDTGNGTAGTVQSLGLFTTELSAADNVYVSAPNSTIWNTCIQNFSRNPERRQDIVVGISYDDDIGKAFKIIQNVLEKDERVLKTAGKEPQVMVSNMADFSVNLIARFWTKTDDYWQVQWDLKKAIKETLDKEGITIPFPTRTVYTVADGKSRSEAA